MKRWQQSGTAIKSAGKYILPAFYYDETTTTTTYLPALMSANNISSFSDITWQYTISNDLGTVTAKASKVYQYDIVDGTKFRYAYGYTYKDDGTPVTNTIINKYVIDDDYRLSNMKLIGRFYAVSSSFYTLSRVFPITVDIEDENDQIAVNNFLNINKSKIKGRENDGGGLVINRNLCTYYSTGSVTSDGTVSDYEVTPGLKGDAYLLPSDAEVGSSMFLLSPFKPTYINSQYCTLFNIEKNEGSTALWYILGHQIPTQSGLNLLELTEKGYNFLKKQHCNKYFLNSHHISTSLTTDDFPKVYFDCSIII